MATIEGGGVGKEDEEEKEESLGRKDEDDKEKDWCQNLVQLLNMQN